MRRAIAITVVLGALAGCRGGETDQPPVHLIQNMFTQEKGRPYRKDTSGLFADGRLMRLPVEGTVAVGDLRDDTLLDEGLGDDGQPSMKFPSQVKFSDAATIRHGELRYRIYCTPCHGLAGDGKGPVASRGLLVPPANLLDQRLKDMTVGKMYSAIRNGVNAPNMPSYAAQIPVEDRWAIIAYVRSLQGVAPEGGANAAPLQPSATASVEFGEKVYKGKICVTCHSLDGTRIVGPSFKGLYGKTESTSAGDVTVDDAYLTESITQPMAKVVTGYPPAMPVQQFGPNEVESLILFIKAQK